MATLFRCKESSRFDRVIETSFLMACVTRILIHCFLKLSTDFTAALVADSEEFESARILLHMEGCIV
jgi:hypothetical protein